jgi:hypothetical protein
VCVYVCVPGVALLTMTSYPSRVRPAYLLEKAMVGAGAISLLFVTVSTYIVPVLDEMHSTLTRRPPLLGAHIAAQP